MEKKLDKTVVALSYNAVIKRIDRSSGKVLEEETIHNLVVNDGKERVRDLIAGLSTGAFSYIGIGESAVAPSATDSALGNESTRASATKSYPSTSQVKYEKVFSFASGESYSITEAGLFDSATVSGSTMLNRLTFGAKAVDADTDLSVAITISVN